jgi:hypothetical protein
MRHIVLLTQSGNLNAPPEATDDLFCNGPCLAETRHEC